MSLIAWTDAPRSPRRSLRRRSWREVEFAALDFETTGLDRDRDAIVSLGVVPVRRGRVIVREALHRLVEPEIPPTPGSMRVHGILPKDLEGADPAADAARALAAAIDERFVLAWFAQVEIAFLRRLYGGRPRRWARRTVDVRQLVIALEGLRQEDRRSLSSAAERYGVPVASPHEALDDALVTAQLFLVVASRLAERGLGSVGAMARLTRATR